MNEIRHWYTPIDPHVVMEVLLNEPDLSEDGRAILMSVQIYCNAPAVWRRNHQYADSTVEYWWKDQNDFEIRTHNGMDFPAFESLEQALAAAKAAGLSSDEFHVAEVDAESRHVVTIHFSDEPPA